MALKTRYSPLQQLSVDNLIIAFSELPPMRKIIALGVIAAVVVLILFLPLSLFSGKVSSLRQNMADVQKGYRQVLDKITEYEAIKARTDLLETRFGKQATSLTTRIEGIAKNSGIAVDQIREKAPQETDFLEIAPMDVKLSQVSLSQLIEILQGLENDTSTPMRIRRIQIKPNLRSRQFLDVSFEVATFRVKKEF